MNVLIRLTLIALFFTSLTACRQSASPESEFEHSGQVAGAVVSHDSDQDDNRASITSQHNYRKTILSEAKAYGNFDCASAYGRWSPYMCALTPAPDSSISDSNDEPTHGRKIYYVYARNSKAYLTLKSLADTPIGQTIVKETWHPVEVDPKNPMTAINTGESVTNPFKDIYFVEGEPSPAERDGKFYQPGEKGPLFIMHYLGLEAPETDAGWIYATLTPDGSEITAIGRIESCMKCHQAAPYGRLFGLKDGLLAP